MPHVTADDGIRLAYQVDDFSDPWLPDDPLLLLHAAIGSSRRWYSMVPALARHHRVIRMDLRGHGESDVPDPSSPFSLERLAQDALTLMDELGLGKVHILGNSAGGYVGQRLAIDNPERVKSLVLYGSTPGLTRSQVSTWAPQMGAMGIRPFLAETISDRFPVDAVDPRFVQWFLDEAANNDLAFIQRFVGHMSTVDMMEQIRAIRCPVLMIAPGAEPVGHASTYEDMKARIPDNELVYYEGARHNIGDYLPDRCAADTLAFLQRRFPRG